VTLVPAAGETLPNGLSLNASGVWSGTPTKSGTYNFDVTASFVNGPESEQKTKSYTLVITSLVYTFKSIAAGDHHTCGVTLTGGVKCWGRGTNGQLGNGEFLDQVNPVDVTGLTSGVASVAVGEYHSCAVTTSGAAKCWGEGSVGQRGTADRNASAVPLDTYNMASGVSQVAARKDKTCFLKSGGVWCTGYWTSAGYFGIARQIDNLTSGVTQIAVGENHGCAIKSGAAMCFNRNYDGQLGNKTTTDTGTLAVQVSGLTSGVKAIAAGAHHSCAIDSADQVLCWGNSASGQAGTTSSRVTSPYLVKAYGLAAQVSAGTTNTCIAKVGGGTHCWGSNPYNQSTPLINGATDVKSISNGSRHTCVIGMDNKGMCVGEGLNGKLGNGDTANSSTFVLVSS
jgi:Alpha-tubulin suppressor and related RCC1 domain-containing proteins